MLRKLLLAVLPLLASCSPTAPPPATAKPNIVLITLDTTRADRMGFLGSPRGLTPNLDALAREGTVFTQAYAQAPLTTVSHATLLTGTYPPYHGVHDFSIPLPKDVPALADLLHEQGYHTAAFVGALILDPVNGMAPGFNRGFDVYDAGYRMRRNRQEDRYQTLERRAEEVVARARSWLAQNSSSGPFFLWVHVFDAHEPYEAPGEFGRRYAQSPYDGEIAYVDSVMGGLFADLKQRKLFSTTTIVVAADHGEAFGEHGEYTHGVFLYDPTIHVPLLIKFHDGHWAGQRYTGRVPLVNLAPTLLAAANLPVPQQMQGRSLIPLLGRPPADLPAYSETQYTRRAFGWSALFALRDENSLYVQAPRPELYDLIQDPEAGQNLANSRPAETQRLGRLIDNFRKSQTGAHGVDSDKGKVDPRLAEKLASLGYIAGGEVTDKPDKDLPDPKDKIQVANLLHKATLLVEQEEPATAIPILRRILSSDPQIFVAQMQLGLALSKLKQYQAALKPLRRGTELSPASGPAHFSLGRALLLTGDSRAAAAHLEIAVDRNPQWANAHFMLGTAYATSERQMEAIQQLRIAYSLDPEHFGTNLVLGRLLAAHGEIAEGLPFLEKAARLRADSRQAHMLLAAAYNDLGRYEDAARVRAIAARLRSSASPVDP